MNDSHTIAAIATPAGRGGVGIVRVSGPAAVECLETLVPDWPDNHPSHKLRLSSVYDAQGALIDEALCVFMKGPQTYTGEDVVEFQCHGGPIILQRVLDATLTAGGRTAGPGEFTERAFLNERIDLTQAEAVADLVEATTASAHELAMEHLQGSLGGAIRDHLELVTEAVTLVESAIDFAHQEHVYQIERKEVLDRVDQVIDELSRLEARFDQGRRQREGVRVVVLGPPNVGKSTLFNALNGSERAIVTDVAGTTRDFLEEEIHLDGVALRVADTAGLRAAADEVERRGVERSRQLQQRADLVIWVVDQSRELPDDQRRELRDTLAAKTPAVVVRNKVDLDDQLTADDRALIERFEHTAATSFAGAAAPDGLDELVPTLADLAEELTCGEGVLLSRTRHLECVRRARTSLERARQAVQSGLEHEFVAVDLREALDALGDIVGRVSTDDILERIFSEFCVGK